MKHSWLFGAALLFSSVSFACADLSHVMDIGNSEVRIRQLGCEVWRQQEYFSNDPLGPTLQFHPLDGSWQELRIDDIYELKTFRERWYWLAAGQRVVHELHIDAYDKLFGYSHGKHGYSTYSSGPTGVQEVGVYESFSTESGTRVVTPEAVSKTHQSPLR